MRLWAVVLFLICWSSLLQASEKHSLDDLKARVEAANPDQKANLCVEIAELQANSADELFRKNDPEAARAAVNDVVSYSGQARDAATVTGHRLKSTEIAVRKVIHKLSDMKRQLSLDDQAPVQSAIDDLEKIRTDLLNRMFKGGK